MDNQATLQWLQDLIGKTWNAEVERVYGIKLEDYGESQTLQTRPDHSKPAETDWRPTA